VVLVNTKIFAIAFVFLCAVSIANASIFGISAAETDMAKIDSVFPKLISNTEQCLTDCSATFTYCLDGTNDVEISFNIPEVTSYGYYKIEYRTEEYQTGKCLKEDIVEHICDLKNETQKDCKDWNETICVEHETAKRDVPYQVWVKGLPSKEKGCYNVTIYGNKKPFDSVDWIPTLKIKGFLWDTEYSQEKWAWWNNSWLN
jgi:hypothetical protein